MLTLLAICFVAFTQLYAQNPNSVQLTDSQLAMQYYRNGEYEKAADIFMRLYQINHSSYYYSYYLNSLLSIPNYVAAEELINTQIKADKTNLKYIVDLGYLYSKKEQPDKAQQIYHQAIKKIKADVTQISQLASAFIEYKLYTQAEQTYLEGRKQLKGAYEFRMEMAQLQYYQHNYNQMIVEFMELLKISDLYLRQVQNYLQQAVYSSAEEGLNETLRKQLIKYSTANPENTVYAELLVWLFTQDKNYPMALIHAKSLDIRLNENGRRVLSLARIASDNNDFKTATEAYQYIVDKGVNNEFANTARTEMLQIMFRCIELGIYTDVETFNQFEQAATQALSDMGINNETIDLVRDLAKLKSIYLGKTAEAQFLLEDVCTMSQLSKQTKAQVNLELADVYLMQGNDTDATLIYAQVETNNSNNPVGHEARLRKARLAYYIGNFKWAQAQLDAIKASTEKLTANDAAALSLLIEDNTGWDDSSDSAMVLYAKADLLNYQHQTTKSLQTIDTILQAYPSAPIVDEALYLKAEIYRKKNMFDEAIAAYQIIAEQHSYDVLADDATFRLATIYQKHLNNQQAAMEQYLKIITDYSSSIFVIEARKQYRLLRGDTAIQ